MNVEKLRIERRPGRSRGPRRGPGFGRLVALAVVAVLVWLFHAPLMATIDRLRLPEVRVLEVARSHPAAAGAVRGTAANGHLVAARRAALSADTPGRIVEMRVTEGSRVEKGDVVARLYADEYRAALEQADANVTVAKSQADNAAAAVETARAQLQQIEKDLDAAVQQVAEAKANEHLVEVEFTRAQNLVTKEISAQSVLDTAQAALDAGKAKVRAAQAQQRAAEAAVGLEKAKVAQAEAALGAAKAEVQVRESARDLAAATLAKTEVRAPFDGIVVLKDAEVGEVVSPNSQGGSNARGAVCTMVDLHSLEAQAEVPETSLSAVHVGAPVLVYLDAFPDHAYTGKVDRIWPTANRQKATIEVRAVLDHLDDRLRPEMGLRIVFLSDQAAAEADHGDDADGPPPILLPEDSVVRVGDQRGVFVVERGVATFRPIELGQADGGKVAVKSGLSVGEKIVLQPSAELSSGDRVRVAEG